MVLRAAKVGWIVKPGLLNLLQNSQGWGGVFVAVTVVRRGFWVFRFLAAWFRAGGAFVANFGKALACLWPGGETDRRRDGGVEA
jgi:hypothetical protein